MKNFIVKLISTGLGTGYSPLASGTAGTALAFGIFWFLCPEDGLILLIIALCLLVISIVSAGMAEKVFGAKDDGRIVIDEVAGYFFAVLFLPKTLLFALSAFFLFRLFDVIKPLGIRKTQDWPGGWGVTFDDIFAGLLSNIILQVAHYAFKI
ncbi:MAG: phosphatidylglycerophosphatase A [Elusimicrobiota bacterium]